MKPTKKSISFIIYNNDQSEFIVVQQPSNDKDLPNAWGLPAGSLKEGESFEEATLRSGKEKLDVGLKIVRLQNSGEISREDYNLIMNEYVVKITNGEPKIPEKVIGITKYQGWKWAKPKDLIDAAKRGSLCSRLFLKNKGIGWE